MKSKNFVLKDKKSIFIDEQVQIGENVIIYENNRIDGDSIISDNVTIFPNSFIVNSIIGKGSKIYSSLIENSKIGANSCVSNSVIIDSIVSSGVYIASFCEIKNSLIGKDSIIEKGVSICNYNIDVNSKIKANTIMGENNDSDSGARKSR